MSNPHELTKEEILSIRTRIYIIFGVGLTVLLWRQLDYISFQNNLGKTESKLSETVAQLYDEEIESSNYLEKVNFQERTSKYEWADHAPMPLLQVNESASLPRTIVLLKRLFENYKLDAVNISEKESLRQEMEELEFLHAVLETPFMTRLMAYLVSKAPYFPSDFNEQMIYLKQLWFRHYRLRLQDTGVGSSAFEHVFMAAINQQKIYGMHNWIYIHEQERLGNFNYQGYLDIFDLDKGNYNAIIRFSFHGMMKSYNSVLIGTPPELQIGLYTACFLLSASWPCHFDLGQSQVTVVTYPLYIHESQVMAIA